MVAPKKLSVMNIRKFPEELQHRAKVQAMIERITLRDLVIKALEQYLKKHEKRR